MDTARSQGTASAYGRRRGSIAGPVILILLGILFLGQNLGWFPPTIWSTLLSYWPVLLILLGLELILGRGNWVGALILGIVVVTIVAALSLVGTFPWTSGTAGIGQFAPVETITMAEEMGQAKRATYQLEFGGGTLNVSALPSGSANLFEATLDRDERAAIDRNVDRQGDLARVAIRGRNLDPVTQVGLSGRTRMAVRLSPEAPTELRINGGAGDLTIDLSSLKVTHVELDAGVGGSRLTLPQSAGQVSARVNLGLGGVDVTIPEGVAAQVRIDRGITGLSIDAGRFPKVSDNTYRSASFDSAANRVDVYISGGVGGITVR